MRDLGKEESCLTIVRPDDSGIGDDEQNMLGHNFAPWMDVAEVGTAAMKSATSRGWDSITAWLLSIETVRAALRLAIILCKLGGIMRSCVVSRYDVGFTCHAGSPTSACTAASPQGTCDAAMKRVVDSGTSAANAVGNF